MSLVYCITELYVVFVVLYKMPEIKKCFVPYCKNSTINSPDKLFLTIPKERTKRLRWLKAVGIPNALVGHGKYCCEDHFQVKYLTSLIVITKYNCNFS